VKTALRSWYLRAANKRLPKGTQITLTQRSIFILPSHFALAFLLAVLLILLVAVNFQQSLAYMLAFLLLPLFFIGLLHSFINLNQLTLTAQGGAAVFAGQAASFHVTLSSKKRAHQAIAIGFSKNALQLQDIPATGSITVELSYPTSKRGWLKPKHLLVQSLFPLGLWRVWSWLCLEQRVLVYPHPLAASFEALLIHPDTSEGQQASGIGVDDFQGQRRFSSGDSLRRLDWKAYSRERGLLVKEFSALQGGQPWLDFSALEGDTETRLSLLCHQVLELCASGQSFGLRLPDKRIEPATGDSQRNSCLQALALYGISP